MAMVAPTIHTLGLVKPLKSGIVTRFLKSSNDCGIGKTTKCFGLIAKELPVSLKISFNKIPATTATRAPGSIFILLRVGILSQAKRIPTETKVTIMAPG